MSGNHRSGRKPKPFDESVVDGTALRRHGIRTTAVDLGDLAARVPPATEPMAGEDVPDDLAGTPRLLYLHVAPWLIATCPGSAGVKLVLLHEACRLLATAEMAAAALAEHGVTMETPSGIERARPEVRIQKDAIAGMHAILIDLGVS